MFGIGWGCLLLALQVLNYSTYVNVETGKTCWSVYTALFQITVIGLGLSVVVLLVRLFASDFAGRRSQQISLFLPLIACLSISLGLCERVHQNAQEQTSARVKAVWSALHQYGIDHRSMPQKLEELCPRYLPQVPKTGLGAAPDLSYKTYDMSGSKYSGGSSWAFSLTVPHPGINNGAIAPPFPSGNP